MQKEVLKINHPCKRDALIKFYQKGHKYEITTDPDSKYTSVTTWCHSHFPKFDPDAVVKNIMNSRSWGPGHKYWGQTPQQIKDSWKNNGTSVAEAGTNLHEQIECFMNDIRFQFIYTHKELHEIYVSDNKKVLNVLSKEWHYFLNFVKDHPQLKPYRTEWMIFDEDVKLAGSIDMIYENPDGTLSIYDWKRSKEISKINTFNKFATNPLISEMHDTNFWHYSLQLNTYRRILENKYGKQVTKLCLVRLHPDAENYELLEVPLLDKEMDLLFEERRNQMNISETRYK